MGPVEDRNAVVVDKSQKPAELISKFGEKQLRHTYDGSERWICVLKHFLKYLVVARQRVFQFHLQKRGWLMNSVTVLRPPQHKTGHFGYVLHSQSLGLILKKLTVAQLLCRLEQRSILCNFVANMQWTLIGQFLFIRQSCSVRHGMSHVRFCRTIKLHDNIAR